MSSVLITGVNGFIGGHLYEYLSRKGHEVLGIGSSPQPVVEGINYQQADIRNRQLIVDIMHNFSVVYHLAAQTNVQTSLENPQLTIDINVSGTENVLYACHQNHASLIFPSSVAVYGTSRKGIVLEDATLDPKSPYAKSKVEAEKLCLAYATGSSLEVAVFRIFNAYGPLQIGDNGIVSLFFETILNGNPPQIYGDGNQERDFIFITDVLEGFEMWQRAASIHKPVNLGTGVGIKIKYLVDILLRYAGSALEPVYINAPRPVNSGIIADISRARDFGFSPKVTFEEGLERYIRWATQARGKQPKTF